MALQRLSDMVTGGNRSQSSAASADPGYNQFAITDYNHPSNFALAQGDLMQVDQSFGNQPPQVQEMQLLQLSPPQQTFNVIVSLPRLVPHSVYDSQGHFP